jgi:hypothetical protein
MADIYVFADEAGNFDFTLSQGASRYFVLTTVMMRDCSIGERLLALRRDLTWRGYHLPDGFHATEDAQAVRDDVFEIIKDADLRVDSTVFDKRKAMPHLQSEARLYKIAWFLHFKYVAPRIAGRTDRLMVTAASIGTKQRRQRFHDAVQDVVQQVSTAHSFKTAFWVCGSDPCLQVADYCCWAVQRKWERGHTLSHELIQAQIRSEIDIWRVGQKIYY